MTNTKVGRVGGAYLRFVICTQVKVRQSNTQNQTSLSIFQRTHKISYAIQERSQSEAYLQRPPSLLKMHSASTSAGSRVPRLHYANSTLHHDIVTISNSNNISTPILRGSNNIGDQTKFCYKYLTHPTLDVFMKTQSQTA